MKSETDSIPIYDLSIMDSLLLAETAHRPEFQISLFSSSLKSTCTDLIMLSYPHKTILIEK